MREILAHVQFRGTIRERSVEPFLALLKVLREKRRVKGVLLDISSGGGADIPSTDFYLAVKRLDQVKPVVASIGSIGASGGYMVGLGARRIYAYPDSEVGSIGVVYPHVAVQKLLEKIGVEVDLLHEGRHKDAFLGFRPLTDEERTKVGAVARDSYNTFIETVARERHRTVDEILLLATGEFWSGKRAIQLGLVDALGDREAALNDLAQITGVSARKTIRFAPPRPFLERFFGGASFSITRELSESFRDTLDDWVLDASLRGRI